MTKMKKMHFSRKASGTIIFSPALALLLCMTSCDADGTAGHSGADASHGDMAAGHHPQKNNAMNNMIKITVGSSTFTATLSNNAAAAAFRALLPLTLKMEDVNGNEKFYRLSRHLPVAAANPGTVREGDLMLWGTGDWFSSTRLFPHPTAIRGWGALTMPPGLRRPLAPGTWKSLLN